MWRLIPTGQQQADAALPPAPIRPPATPLAVRSMYLSTWLAGDRLAGQWPTFWSGQVTGLTGIVRIDGSAYVFAGAPAHPSLPLLEQTACEITGTRSTYRFHGGGVALTVNFLSPVDPTDLRRQCVPMSYITVTAESADNHDHQVSVYLDISGEWAHGDRNQHISWEQVVVGPQIALSYTPTHPRPLAEHEEQAAWGTVVFATDNTTGTTWQIAHDVVARVNGAAGALPNTAEPGPRAINDRWPVFAVHRDFGRVAGGQSIPVGMGPSMVVTLGHVRTPAVSYLSAPLDPWWKTYWPDWQGMLTWFRSDYDEAVRRCADTDARVVTEASQIFSAGSDTGAQYASLCSLALRQAFAGTELVVNPDGKPWAMLKEISSNGNMCTVDVLYPAAPVFLYLAPEYLRLLMAPVFDYVEAGHWPRPYAPHDLGVSYPNATAHNDGGGQTMPVEESANMLIMSAASREPGLAHGTRYATLRGWAEYLVEHALDPGYQDQTDDFTGFIAHSSNLALKGILGIGAMGLIARAAGNDADAERYEDISHDYITQWVRLSRDPSGAHLKLAYDRDGTWSLKYNGYADRLLGLNLIPTDIADTEAAWYLKQAQPYGVPLDVRHTYTKADWELWTAGWLTDHPEARDLFVRRVFRFANETPDRVPFTDWYDTRSSHRERFTARPVIGGVYGLLAYHAGRPGTETTQS